MPRNSERLPCENTSHGSEWTEKSAASPRLLAKKRSYMKQVIITSVHGKAFSLIFMRFSNYLAYYLLYLKSVSFKLTNILHIQAKKLFDMEYIIYRTMPFSSEKYSQDISKS